VESIQCVEVRRFWIEEEVRECRALRAKGIAQKENAGENL
jgi:hypothetical protein